MTENLRSDLLKAISFVPGLIDLANIDFSQRPVALSGVQQAKGFSVIDTESGKNVYISAIIGTGIRAKVVAKEISSSVKNVFKNHNLKVNKINVYIRGVR